MYLKIKVSIQAMALGIMLFFLSGCGKEEEQEFYFELPPLDPQVVIPPGHPAYLNGDTLVIEGYNTPPMVHSYPGYSGVERVGEIGIGTAAGYDVQDGFTLPINANLGEKKISYYRFKLTISPKDILRITQIIGNDPNLAQQFPEQYLPAIGFINPTVSWGESTSNSVQLELSSGSSSPASGRINLANLRFIIKSNLPKGGVKIDFEVESLMDGSTELCHSFPDGCDEKDGLVISDFRIKN